MSEIISELERVSRRAKQAEAKAQRAHDAAAKEARDLLKTLEAARARVHELESVISILRNNLRPGATPSDNKVVPLKK